jgi:hypothetical protein
MRALFVRAVPAFFVLPLPIPVKPPVCNGMIAPRDSWMMPAPCNEMIPHDPARGAALVGRESFFPLRGRRSSRFGLFASGAAQALAGEFDAMRVVHEAVQNGVGVSGVADDLVPGGQREL